MNQQYLIRLDDACPTMNHQKWGSIERLLDTYGIKPMAGVVPHNADVNLQKDIDDKLFWNIVSSWQKKGWAIALHGYDHCYISDNAGINPMWYRSEFAGVPLQLQKEKIRLGVSILKEQQITPRYFFAPSHTFDTNTLKALCEESDIRIISDGIGRYPYRQGEFYFIPQIVGHCIVMPMPGIYTFCFHPNMMNSQSFSALEEFLKAHSKEFISFDQIDLTRYGEKKLFDRLLSWLFFSYRKIRGLR